MRRLGWAIAAAAACALWATAAFADPPVSGLAAAVTPADAPAEVTVAGDAPEAQTESAQAKEDREDAQLEIKLSLPTESDRQAWRNPGFRVYLGYAYGWLRGLSGTPGGDGHGFVIRAGARVDPDWSLIVNFIYASVTTASNVSGTYGTPSTGMSGLRFMGTLDPTWHATENLHLSMGLGFAGLVEGRTGRLEPDTEQRPTLVSSYTFPKAYPPISSCSGVGAAALARAQWLWVLGPMLSTGATVQVDGQWTGCVEQVGQVEPDTARPITRRQWWPQVGWSLGWVLGWR